VLCTKCSEVLKPVVAFDIDGTMGDYHSHFLEFASEYLGHRGNQDWHYAGHEGFRTWFCRAFECEDQTWYDIKLSYRQGAQKRSMPAYKQMIYVARTAYRAGCEVWVTTTRPYQRLDGIDPDTREWLRRHRVPYEGLIYSEDKYVDLSERIDRERVVAVYDDQPDMLNQAADVFGRDVPFLVQTRWNRAVLAEHRGGHLEAMAHLEINLAAWRSVHEERQVQSV
jgi:hypothetical protein